MPEIRALGCDIEEYRYRQVPEGSRGGLCDLQDHEGVSTHQMCIVHYPTPSAPPVFSSVVHSVSDSMMRCA